MYIETPLAGEISLEDVDVAVTKLGKRLNREVTMNWQNTSY